MSVQVEHRGGYDLVPSEWLAEILQREIRRRELVASSDENILHSNRGTVRSGYTILLDEIEASGLLTRDTASRRIWDVLHPPGDGYVRLETADKILTALDLPHVWHEA